MSDTVVADSAEQRAEEALRRLSPRQRALVLHYTDPKSPAYSNKTRSAIEAGYSERSAYATVHGALDSHKVQNAMQALFEYHGLDMQVRAGAVADVAKGTYRQTIETEYADKDGNSAGKSTIRRTPTAQQRLQAVKLANEMDGTDAQRDAAQQAVSHMLKAKIQHVQGGEAKQAESASDET